jgi:hypothetical protein
VVNGMRELFVAWFGSMRDRHRYIAATVVLAIAMSSVYTEERRVSVKQASLYSQSQQLNGRSRVIQNSSTAISGRPYPLSAGDRQALDNFTAEQAQVGVQSSNLSNQEVVLSKRQVLLGYLFLVCIVGTMIGSLIEVIVGKRRKKRIAAGQCVNCAYDLRSSPNRCPECGMIRPIVDA